MGVPPYTRGDIITEGLLQVGRTDLMSNGRKWLNLFLDKVYCNWDWPFLRKYSGIIPLTQSQNFPSDYRKMSSSATLYVSTQSGYVAQRELPSMSADEYAAVLRIGNISASQPRKFYISQNLSQFVFWPPPDTTYWWDYYYFQRPVLPTDADGTGDTIVPLWPNLPQQILINAIQMKAMYFNDDERYAQEEKDIMAELSQLKMNSYDTEAGSNKIKLGKSFRRRY